MPRAADDPAVNPMPDQEVKRSFDTTSDFATKFSNRVRGLDFANLVFIEVFSGTAGLTAAVRRVGCQHGTGVDAHVTKQVKAPVIRINLATQQGQELLWRILQQPRVFAVHLGPPCGTSSRAREIKRKFGYSPKPLRSQQYPDGLPHLPPKDQARVDTANNLYKLSGEILAFTTARGILCSLENPLRSHMWNTSFLQNAIDHISQQLVKVQFHHCMFGGRRRKRTQPLVNHDCYKHLQRNCDETHTHEPWGRTSAGWATSLEVEYPMHSAANGLCASVMQQFNTVLLTCLLRCLATSQPTSTIRPKPLWVCMSVASASNP